MKTKNTCDFVASILPNNVEHEVNSMSKFIMKKTTDLQISFYALQFLFWTDRHHQYNVEPFATMGPTGLPLHILVKVNYAGNQGDKMFFNTDECGTLCTIWDVTYLLKDHFRYV